MHSWAAMLIEIDKKQEIGLVTSCSKIKDNTLKWHDGIVCKYTDLKKNEWKLRMPINTKKMLYILHLYYEESHYFNDTQLWNIKNNWTKICILTKWGDGRNAGKKR